MPTLTQARDILFAHAKVAINGALGIHWPDQPFTIPDDSPYCRVSLRHATGAQSGLAGSGLKTRQTRTGTLFIDTFYPVGENLEDQYVFAQGLLSSFAKVRNSQVFYRNIQVIELGDDGSFQHFQFSASFEYDDAQ